MPTPALPPPSCSCSHVLVVIVRSTPGSAVVFQAAPDGFVGGGRPVSLGRWWVSVPGLGSQGGGPRGCRCLSPHCTVRKLGPPPTSELSMLLTPPSVPCAPAPSQNALCKVVRLCSPHALLYHSSNLMKFNKSLFMPVCIMVKILKSGLNSTGSGLLFDWPRISHFFCLLRAAGWVPPRSPVPDRGGRRLMGGDGVGREPELPHLNRNFRQPCGNSEDGLAGLSPV